MAKAVVAMFLPNSLFTLWETTPTNAAIAIMLQIALFHQLT
jgi:hypothetical protein